MFFDERLVVPDVNVSLKDGALAPWAKSKSPYFIQTIQAIAEAFEFSPSDKWKDLPPHVQQLMLYGSGDQKIKFRYDDGGRVYEVNRVFEGVFRTWNGAIARRIQTGCERNLSATKPTVHAQIAEGIAFGSIVGR